MITLRCNAIREDKDQIIELKYGWGMVLRVTIFFFLRVTILKIVINSNTSAILSFNKNVICKKIF